MALAKEVMANVFAKPKPMPCKPVGEVAVVRYVPGYQQLTDKQRASAKKIMQQFRKQVSPMRQQLYAKKVLLNAELVQPSIDQKKIDALVNDISDLRKQLFTAKVQMVIQMNKATGLMMPVGKPPMAR